MIIKDVRLLILVVLVGISLYLIISPALSSVTGIVVARVDDDAKCTNVGNGVVITQVGIVQTKTIQDYERALRNIKVGEFTTLIANGLPANCIALRDGYLGFDATTIKKEGLTFGIDVEGGSRVLLKLKGETSKEVVSDTISILTTRINLYGLRDLRIYPIGEGLIQVEMGGATSEEIVDFVSRQGKFEGKFEQIINIVGGTGNFIFADKPVSIKLLDGTVEFDNEEYDISQSYVKDGINFGIKNVTNNTVQILSTIFTGKDIVAVYTDPQNSYLSPIGNGYEFVFTIQTTQESANRFAKLTSGQPVRLSGNERFLEPQLVLFLDDEQVTKLSIAASLAGQSLTKPSIQGFRETRDDALNERLKLQSILKSGSLPVQLEIIKTDVVTQTAGKVLVESTIYVAMAAAAIVSAVILYRYRDFKIAIPMILISFSEIILVLGFAAFSQVATKGNGWVLDIPAIAGLIAIIGTGVNQLIIVTDQMLQEKETSVKFRHKIARSIIFNSAYIVMAAMIPLMIAGVGILKGFAITTVIGVLIAIFITRPAYMVILERVKQLT